MGDLQRSLFQKKLAEAEAKLGMQFHAEDEFDFADEDGDVLTPLASNSITTNNDKSQLDALPSWSAYFRSKEKFHDEKGSEFNVYYTPPMCDESPIFIFHHGAGSSGLTFAPLAKELIYTFQNDPEGSKSVCGLLSFDARGHGETRVPSSDFSLDSFVSDFVWLLREFIEKYKLRNSLILIGHSLGGSVLTRALYQLQNLPIKGLGMFDIVEDTAVQSLQGMHVYLSNLPKSFDSLNSAIDWHIKSGLIRSRSAASISVPSYLKLQNGKYVWILDLFKTAPFWDTWFTGLSKSFVDAPTSKLLILAGTDSLDKELMIGQMQGKYQLVVYQDSGHFIQEDSAKKTAITLLDFWKRNDRKTTVIKTTWGSVN